MGLLNRRKKVVRNKDAGTEVERYGKSLMHAIDGFDYCLYNEHNLIIMLAATVFVVVAGLSLNLSLAEWLFCIAMIGAVITCEMINSSIEAVVDLTTQEFHELAKIAKDCGSAASLMISITALIGALLIFVPKILELL